MIEILNLCLQLPDFSLKDINLRVERGEFFALIGPTGSGKSLLLEAIIGLLNLRSGKVIIEGREVTKLPPEKRGLGIVYQDYALFPHLSVKKNILYGVKYQDIPPSKVNSRFQELTATLNLKPLLERKPTTLSGGEKQRVALARVMILNPSALLLDEPLSALDPMFQDEIKDVLQKLHHKMGTTFIMVSHNFSDVLYLADRGAIINKGEIIQTGHIQELFQKPDSSFAAQFVGMKNLFPARIKGNQAVFEDFSIYLSSKTQGRDNYLALRPEDIIPAKNPINGFDNLLSGKIKRLVCKGFYFEASIEVGKVTFFAVWTRDQVEEKDLSPGQQIKIAFQSKKIHTFYQ